MKAMDESPWISVNDRLPETDSRDFNEKVLAYTPIDTVRFRLLPVTTFKSFRDVTHWMPIPELPDNG